MLGHYLAMYVEENGDVMIVQELFAHQIFSLMRAIDNGYTPHQTMFDGYVVMVFSKIEDIDDELNYLLYCVLELYVQEKLNNAPQTS